MTKIRARMLHIECRCVAWHLQTVCADVWPRMRQNVLGIGSAEFKRGDPFRVADVRTWGLMRARSRFQSRPLIALRLRDGVLGLCNWEAGGKDRLTRCIIEMPVLFF